MFSKLRSKWKSSVLFRLNFTYTAIFALFFFVIFTFLFLLIINHIYSAKDEWIFEETKEMEALEITSLEALKKHMLDEAYYAGSHNIFYSLRNLDGKIIVSSEGKYFKDIVANTDYFGLTNEKFFFKTMHLKQGSFRVLFLPTKNQRILQCAMSLKEQISFRDSIITTFFIMYCFAVFCSYNISFYMIKISLKPVEAITQIANEISMKDLTLRVPVNNANDEMGNLSVTLNNMLSRIELLVGELKNMNANLAHDLRTILSRISINLEISLMKKKLSEQSKYLVIALDDCKYLTNILNQVLDISEIETGIIPLKKDTFKISKLMRSIDIFQDIATYKNINLQITNQSPDSEISGDFKRLELALANIVDNSLKYTPENGSIEVSIFKKNTNIIISIKDDGAGIKEHDLPLVFDRFYRSDEARTMVGSGLGLAQSKAIFDAHKIKLSVESQFGIGSTFYIEFQDFHHQDS